MNTMELNKIALPAEDIEPMAFESTAPQSATAPSQPVPKSRHEAKVRVALLAVIALLLGLLGLYVQQSINVINSQLKEIHSSMVTEGSLGPD